MDFEPISRDSINPRKLNDFLGFSEELTGF
jgi:hypothetical protein